MIPIYKPYISNYNNSAINEIKNEWISNHGIFVNLSTEILNKIFNVKYSILMNNGTSATHCLLLAIKYKYPNINKIYLPNHVFIAPVNCAIKEYGINNVEILKTSINNVNFCMDKEYLLSLEKNSALVIVHNLGYIIDIDYIKELRPDIVIVEDNCEGIFGKYNNKLSGTDTLCSSLSFYGNKTITTGEGGCFLTNDIDVYNYIKTIYSHGMGNERYVHTNIGYNYRMTNIQAALLYEQLNDIDNILMIKKNIFNNYDELIKKELNDFSMVYKIKDSKNTVNSYWMYVLFIKKLNYKKFEIYMEQKNIQIRPLFYNMKKHNHLKNIITHENNENTLFSEGFMLPSYPELSLNQQNYIILSIKDYLIANYLTNGI